MSVFQMVEKVASFVWENISLVRPFENLTAFNPSNEKSSLVFGWLLYFVVGQG